MGDQGPAARSDAAADDCCAAARWASVQPFGARIRKPTSRRDVLHREVRRPRSSSTRRSAPRVIHRTRIGRRHGIMLRAYFNGYALSTYLTTPFFMAPARNHGHRVGSDRGRRASVCWASLRILRIGLPATANRRSSLRQRISVAPPRLPGRRRRSVSAIQYVYDMVEADGIKLPSKRRAYRCDADGQLMPDELMVSIDLADMHLR